MNTKKREKEGGGGGGVIIMIDKSLNKIIIFPKRKQNYLNTFSTLAGQATAAIRKQSVLDYTPPPLADGYT